MGTEKRTAVTDGSGSSKNVPYYMDDADLPDLPPPVRKLLEEYSKIPSAQVQPHVLELVRHLCFDSKSSIRLPYLPSPFLALHAFSWRLH